MSVFGYSFWILLTPYIDIIKLIDCKSIITTKKFLMEAAEDSLATFVMKPERQPFDSTDNDFEPRNLPTYNRYTSRSSGSDNAAVLYIFISVVIVIVYLIIRCCIHLIKEGDESNTESNAQRILHFPPERRNNQGAARRSRLSGSRSLAPPRASPSSLILLPEERHLQTLFQDMQNPALVGIENPTYNIYNQDGRSSNPTPLLDLPPDYESIIKDKSVKEEVNVTEAKDPPPNYNNL